MLCCLLIRKCSTGCAVCATYWLIFFVDLLTCANPVASLCDSRPRESRYQTTYFTSTALTCCSPKHFALMREMH